MSSSALLKATGVSPFTIGGVLVVIIFSFVFILPLLSMGTVLNSGFGLLGQGLATAEQTLSTLIAGGSQVIDSGIQLLGAIQEQGAIILSNAVTSAGTLFETFTSIMTTALISIIQIGTTAIVASGQIFVSLAETLASSITLMAAGITQIFFTLQAGILQFTALVFDAVVGTGLLVTSAITGIVANYVASISSIFVAILGVVGAVGLFPQLTLIRVSLETAPLLPSIFLALITAIINVFNTIYKFFTSTVPNFLTKYGTIVGEKIVEGFEIVGQGISDFLESIF